MKDYSTKWPALIILEKNIFRKGLEHKKIILYEKVSDFELFHSN